MNNITSDPAKIDNKVDLLSSSINSINDVLVIIDKDFNIIEINNIGLEYLNKSDNDVVGKKCYHIFHDTTCVELDCPLKKAQESEKTELLERFDEKNKKWLFIKATPNMDQDGKIVHYVETMSDITHIKEREHILKEKKL
ncbi:MAG: PAS domain-containing protein [Bacteroidales bacterium]|nr:PAS domain-containing protein [Bacteroidales bacterium]